MKFIEQKIPGVFLIQSEPFQDDRGVFRRLFCTKEYETHGLSNKTVQINESRNRYKHTLRGFHYQQKPYGEDKTITCLQGSFYDVVVDLRPDSPTYLKWIHIDMSAKNLGSLHVPAGCANAFMTLEDDTVVHYYASQAYFPSSERGIRYNDPTFNFIWPKTPEHISKKDQEIPNFDPKVGSYQ